MTSLSKEGGTTPPDTGEFRPTGSSPDQPESSLHSAAHHRVADRVFQATGDPEFFARLSSRFLGPVIADVQHIRA